MLSLICGYKNCNALVNITKKKTQTHRYREQTSGYQWGGGEGQYGGRGVGSTSCRVQDGSGCVVQHSNIAYIL